MSDKTLDKLIFTLKTEAIEAAEQESAAIRAEARKKADQLLAETKTQCDTMLADARKQADQTLAKGQGALRQAARDVTVSLQNDLLQLMSNVLEQEVSGQFKPEVIREAIVRVLENIGGGVEVKLSDDLLGQLSGQLQQKIQASDAVVKKDDRQGLSKHITISKTDEGWSYQINPETVSELLKTQLSDSWVEMINKS